MITGTSNHITLEQLVNALRRNAASVPSLKEGGLFGHTALTTDDATYATLAQTN